MSRENITNFASTTLLNPLGTADPSFTVASGGGSTFPVVSTPPAAGVVGALPYTPRSFVVLIDTEFIVVSARSGDVFTIQSRGYDGTTVASHAAAASVDMVLDRDMLNRLWSATADVFHPDVPPYDLYTNAAGPNGSSDEFDSQSSQWTMYPLTSNLGGSDTGASIDFSSTYRSHVTLQRLTASTTTYWMYQPITLPGAAVIKWKWSHGLQAANLATTPQLTGFLRFFISDLLNPTAGPWSSNCIGIGLGYDQSGVSLYQGLSNTSQKALVPVYQTAYSVANAYTLLSYAPVTGEHYGALTCTAPDGGGHRIWTVWVGDGLTWNAIGAVQLGFTPQSCGFRLEISNTNSTVIQQMAAIDWLRVGTHLLGVG